MLVTFSGLDGSGKTTQIELFSEFLRKNNYKFKMLTMYDDISSAAFMRKLLRKNGSRVLFDKNDGMIYRSDKNRKDSSRVFLRKITYILDLFIVMIKSFYYQKIKGYILVMDRYLYDSLANLYNTNSDAYSKFMLKIAPKPDLTIFLDAKPDVAYDRKPEYPPAYYYERRKAYLHIFSEIPSVEVIESKDGAMGAVSRDIRNAFVNAAKSHRQKTDKYSYYVEIIARTLYGDAAIDDDFLRALNFKELTAVLEKNRITVRWFTKYRSIFNEAQQKEIDTILTKERNRVSVALEAITQVTREFEKRNLSMMVIKTMDNYPDLGHDVDLYTDAPVKDIDDILFNVFRAKLEKPNIAERIATKRNYKLPGNTTLEIHCGKLGEVGEETAVANDLLKHRIRVTVDRAVCYVPTPEYRILLCTLQRMYRHFNIRLCDVYNTIGFIKEGSVDWQYLEKIARGYGIWEGVLKYLSYVQKIEDYYLSCHCEDEVRNVIASPEGAKQSLPIVMTSKNWPDAIMDKNMHFRFPLLSTGMAVYTKRILSDIQHIRLVSVARLSLVMPMSIMHFASVKLFGKSRVW